MRVRDIDASLRFYAALGFEQRGRLNFKTAFNISLGLPGGGDVLELTVNDGSGCNGDVTLARLQTPRCVLVGSEE